MTGKRGSLLFTILLCYLIPVVVFTAFSRVDDFRFRLFSIAIASVCFLTILWLFRLQLFEKNEQREMVPVYIPAPAPVMEVISENELKERIADLEEVNRRLTRECEEIKEKWYEKKQEAELLEGKTRKYENEQQQFIIQTQEQIKRKELLLGEYSETVKQLKTTLENKQEQIDKLQNSLSDITYDLDTLLKVTPVDQPAPLEPVMVGEYDAKEQLKKCVNIAQKITTSHFAEGNRFAIQNSALDLRRLYDSYRAESSCIIFLYSMRDGNVLFANDMTRDILGWSPEKFVQDFFSLMQKGREEWQAATVALSRQSEVQLHLVWKRRESSDLLLQCRLGVIPTGLFKNHAVGILYEV